MTVCGPNGDIVVFERADIVRDVRLTWHALQET